jgi:hypothetical protein
MSFSAANARHFVFHPLHSPLFAFVPPYQGLGQLSRGWRQRFQREYQKRCKPEDQPRATTFSLEDGTMETQWICPYTPKFKPLLNSQGFFCCLPRAIPINEFVGTLLDYVSQLPPTSEGALHYVASIDLLNIPHSGVRRAIESISALKQREVEALSSTFHYWINTMALDPDLPLVGNYALHRSAEESDNSPPVWVLDWDDRSGAPSEQRHPVVRIHNDAEVRLLLHALIVRTMPASIVVQVLSEEAMYDVFLEPRDSQREREYTYTYTLLQQEDESPTIPEDEGPEEEGKHHSALFYVRNDDDIAQNFTERALLR